MMANHFNSVMYIKYPSNSKLYPEMFSNTQFYCVKKNHEVVFLSQPITTANDRLIFNGM